MADKEVDSDGPSSYLDEDDDHLLGAVKEVQSTNRFILKRLNQIVGGQCSCSCCKEHSKELTNLRTRVEHLITKDREREDELNQLKRKLEGIQSMIEQLQKLQTPVDFHVAEGGLPFKVKGSVKPVEVADIYSYHVTVTHDNQETSTTDSPTKDSASASAPDTEFKTIDNPARTSDISQSQTQTTDNKFHLTETSNTMSKTSSSREEDRTKVRFKEENEVFKIEREEDYESEKANVRTTNKAPAHIIEQTDKRTVHPLHWDWAASQEQLHGRMSGLQNLKGLLTVVCVDVSFSMSKDGAWDQTGMFFRDFIKGLRESLTEHNVSEESVALVTFGHETSVVKRLTKDLTSLQSAFDGLRLGGPSPMLGGLLMSTAAAQSSPYAGVTGVNGIPVFTKLVLITDGYPTDNYMVSGPDQLDPSQQDQTYSKIVEIMCKMEDQFEVIIVPVGRPNMEFLELIKSCSDGEIVTHKDGLKIGRRLRRTLQAGKRRDSGIPFPFAMDETKSDEEDIKEILEKCEKKEKRIMEAKYVETANKDLPVIGSRVRRGPDWKYGDQDGGQPGTVVGHSEHSEGVWVEWDRNGNINVYQYGKGGYDVLIVDEPRMPKPDGRLAVGCAVKPGPDWKQTTRNVKVTDKGVVIRVLADNKVQVRWDQNKKGDYTHSLEGIFEVEFCPSDEMVADFSSMPAYATAYRQTKSPAPTKPVKNKNKNKNT